MIAVGAIYARVTVECCSCSEEANRFQSALKLCHNRNYCCFGRDRTIPVALLATLLRPNTTTGPTKTTSWPVIRVSNTCSLNWHPDLSVWLAIM